jgi:EpsI family protein
VPFARTAPEVVPRPVAATIATLAVAALLLVPLALRPHVEPARPGLFLFPMEIGDWRGTLDLIDPEIERVLATDDYLLADFRDDSGEPFVNLWVAYYGSLLREGSQIHQPTTCLPGAGWEFTELGAHRTALENLQGEPLVVNRAVIVHGTERMLMYFWLELRGEPALLGQAARLRNLADSLTLGRSDGALVRVFTPLEPGETPAAADARIERFLGRAYPHLAPHVGL